MALTYGDTEIIYNKNGVLVIGRKYFDSVAVIVLSKGLVAEPVSISLPDRFKTSLKTHMEDGIRFNGNQIDISASIEGYQLFYK